VTVTNADTPLVPQPAPTGFKHWLPELGRRWRASSLAVRALWTVLATANLVLVVIMIAGFFVSDVGYDWLIFREAGRRAFAGGLYDWEGVYAWSYSPLLAYVFAALMPVGFLGWSLLHVAAVLALRDRWLIPITLVSWPFWVDLYNGNTMTFVFVAAAGAVRRSPAATIAYLALCLLMPRPVMLPLMLWVLWTQPRARTWFVVLLMLGGILVLATGQAAAWLDALLRVPTAVAESSRDIGPARLIGIWWFPLGALLAAALTLRGRIGWASVAASPYLLPQYLLMLLLELIPYRSSPASTPANGSDPSPTGGR
jgi:hypothetical protein